MTTATQSLVSYTSKAGKTATYRATARVQSKFGPGYRLHLVSMDGRFDFWVDEKLTGPAAPQSAATRQASPQKQCWECGGMFTYRDAKDNGGDWNEGYCGC